MSRMLFVFVLAMVPIFEQRGAIPLGVAYGFNPLIVFIISYLGSLVPAPFILLLFNSIYNFLKKHKKFGKIVELIDNKISKNKDKLEKYKERGLITFIAIPLPTTGVWTGCAIAAFLGLSFKKSMFCAAVGALISALLITLICMLIPGFMSTPQF